MAKPPQDIRTRGRMHANRAIEKMVELVARDDVSASTQLAAAKQLLELAYAPPPHDSEADDKRRPIGEKLTPREITALRRKLLGEERFQANRAWRRRPRSERKRAERERAGSRAMQEAEASRTAREK